MENSVNSEASNNSLLDVLGRTYGGKRIFVTGHNGFVGSWLSSVLLQAGAQIVGYSLPQYSGGMAELIELNKECTSIEGDVRNLRELEAALHRYEPEIIFHLAAQPLVIPSFENPLETLSTNIMGTANVLDAIRRQKSLIACVVVTSDKCYATAPSAHDESDPLGGDDIYSASKGAAEIITHAFRMSFLQQSGPSTASARAGNIVGGGDWAEFRIVPDMIRAIRAEEPVCLRHPNAIRPWQHVLDAVAGYLRLGDALVRNGSEAAEGWNFGPHPDAEVTVAELVELFLAHWRQLGGGVQGSIYDQNPSLSEREYLTLRSFKAETRLGWSQLLNFEETIGWTAEWYFKSSTRQNAREVTHDQIHRYLEL